MSYEKGGATARTRLGRRRQHTWRAGLAAGAVGALMLTTGACGSSEGGSDDVIKLGISTPLSGAVGSSCGPMNRAMRAWFSHVNKSGGVHGAKIEIENRDDAYDASRAVTNTKKFIADKVVAVTGQCGSLQPPAQLPLLQSANIPFLFTFGASTKLLNPPSPMYFNLMPDYGTQLELVVPWLFDHYGRGKVVIMNTTTPDSEETTRKVKNAVQKAGGTFAAKYDAPPGTANLAPYVQKMKQLHPDYVFIDQTPQDGARLTKAMKAQNFAPNKKIVGSSAVSIATFLSTVDPALRPKLVVTSDTMPPAQAASTECAKVLKAAHLQVEGVTLRGCGTAQAVVRALKDAPKPVTSKGIVAALKKWNNVKASEVFPPATFAGDRHVGLSSLYVLAVKKGEYQEIGQLG